MFDITKRLTIDKDYKIRKEKFGAIIFHRPTLGISKTTEFVFEIYKQIDENHYSAKELLKIFDISKEDEGEFIEFLSNLYEDGGIQYGEKRLVPFKQVFDKIDEHKIFQAPNMVWWDITSACNLNCYYCYSASGCKKPDELTYEETIDIINQLSEMGVFYIYFLGGEPFMKERFIDILEHVYYKAGMGIMLTTNGTLINEKNIDKLKIISNIRVSLDSADEKIHNAMRRRDFSYKKSIEALSLISKLNLPNFGINSTISPDNYTGIRPLYDLAKSLKCNVIQMIPVCASGRANETGSFLTIEQMNEVRNELRNIQKEIKEHGYYTQIDAPEGYVDKDVHKELVDPNIVPDIMGCSAGKTCLAIQQNGKVAYCLMYRNAIGDLKVDKFDDLFKNVHKKVNENKRNYCSKCKHNDNCYGPCMVYNNVCDCEDERDFIANNVINKQ